MTLTHRALRALTVPPAVRRPLALPAVCALITVSAAGVGVGRRIIGRAGMTLEIKAWALITVAAAVATVWAWYRYRGDILRPPSWDTRCSDTMMIERLQHVVACTGRLTPDSVDALQATYERVWAPDVDGAVHRAAQVATASGRLDLDVAGDGSVEQLLDDLLGVCGAAADAALAALTADIIHPEDLAALNRAWDTFGLPRTPGSPTRTPTPLLAGGIS